MTGPVTDGMIANDAVSLYPAAMNRLKYLPDITTYQMLEEVSFDSLSVYPHYIIVCDIYIPKELQFSPIPVKMLNNAYGDLMNIKGGDKIKGCFYATGNFYNQSYNEIDIGELIKIGGKVLKVHSAMVFTGSIINFLKPFV